MSNEFRKCNFCSYYDEYEGREWGCNNHEDFKPDNDRIITKAKEKGISVADVIALININWSTRKLRFIGIINGEYNSRKVGIYER